MRSEEFLYFNKLLYIMIIKQRLIRGGLVAVFVCYIVIFFDLCAYFFVRQRRSPRMVRIPLRRRISKPNL